MMDTSAKALLSVGEWRENKNSVEGSIRVCGGKRGQRPPTLGLWEGSIWPGPGFPATQSKSLQCQDGTQGLCTLPVTTFPSRVLRPSPTSMSGAPWMLSVVSESLNTAPFVYPLGRGHTHRSALPNNAVLLSKPLCLSNLTCTIETIGARLPRLF